ncbi:RAMP superfamily CRISPR-associated protein [Desulfurobacterium sp.]
MSNFAESRQIFAIATDPIYIGTGGYTIGRVDNTIVRDPITKIPKIPGSSIAGTWRYYVTLELQSHFKEEYKADLKKREEHQDDISRLFNNPKDWMKNFNGNRFAKIKCAGQDEEPQKTLEESKAIDTGHCGHCIVCKAFGYSKKDYSWQGMLFFSDFNILFFPVYTRLGTKWITSERILREAGLIGNSEKEEKKIVFALEKIEEGKEEGYINLGWLNLPYKVESFLINLSKVKDNNTVELKPKDIIIVPDPLISQIINSNLEVRTSVSINPITGAAKEGALFTSEAIPRGTIFYGEIRLFDKKQFGNNNLPSRECILEALDDSKKYYEILGIGGMTTRGFGRIKILTNLKDGECKNNETNEGGNENGNQS